MVLIEKSFPRGGTIKPQIKDQSEKIVSIFKKCMLIKLDFDNYFVFQRYLEHVKRKNKNQI